MDKDQCNPGNQSSIKPINVDTVHKICSGQVVLSLGIAVKELVENSLDAGATNVEIRFKNHGIDLIEVSDNGTGVIEENFAALTLKYHTSKLNDYSDLLGVSSFGFRGEALSSLCALANLTITTRHKSSEYASKIEYDQKGNIVKKTPCSRQIGTTVSLTNLFYSLPVRQKEFHKNVKREFNKMTQLLYAYCLISLGVKITCSNHTNSNQKSIVVATQGSTSYKDNISCIFGVKQLQSILEIQTENISNIKQNIFKGLSGEVEEAKDIVDIEDVEIDLSEDSNEADTTKNDTISPSQKSQGHRNCASPVEFTGFISSCAHGSGRSSTDRQFFFVNSRPCEPAKVIKLINEIYRQYNPNQYPFVFLNVNIDRTSVDVNVTPDKRKVFMTKEKVLLDVLKHSILKLFESVPRTLKVDQTLHSQEFKSVKPELEQPRIFNSFLQQFGKSKSYPESKSTKEEKQELKRKSTTMLDFVSSKTAKTNIVNLKVTEDKGEKKIDYKSMIRFEENSDESEDSDTHNNSGNAALLEIDEEDISHRKSKSYDESNSSNPTITKNKNREIVYLESTDNLPTTQIRDISEVLAEKSHTIVCKSKSISRKAIISKSSDKTPAKKTKILTDKEDIGKYNRKTVTLKTSLEHVKALTDIYQKNKVKRVLTKVKFKSEINPVFNKKCEEELTKEISKESFKEMKVIGQFNLGFIIAKLEDDLFIIDQHATDEIYNFETLQKTTELTSQKLVVPQQLELTGVNEQILMDNLHVFKKNGFTFLISEDALPTKRVKLLTLPMSKNWIFGKEDIEELLFMLRMREYVLSYALTTPYLVSSKIYSLMSMYLRMTIMGNTVVNLFFVESPSEYCRPSRVRAMFASRACRKSVMIGTALGKADMKKLVDHMAEIDKPWNCPHGRPTIRHLVNLAMVHTRGN